MTLPAEFQENIDWVNQPPPPNARDTHALHFWLTSPAVTVYQGLMFYRPGQNPSGPITQRQNGIQGKGFWTPTMPLCETLESSTIFGSGVHRPPGPWVRVQVTFRTTTSGEFPIFSNMIFQDDSGISGLPGDTLATVEFDRVEVADPGEHPTTPPSSRLRMFTDGDLWTLSLWATTVSL
jgi:hypothetical protein